MIVGIYKITSPSNRVYVGQSLNIERRFKHYKNLNGVKGQKKVYYSLKKYGYENHTFEVIEECEIDELDFKEKYWIDFYNSCNEGLNSTEGGNSLGKSNKGKKRSIETRNKISQTKQTNPRKITQEAIMNHRNSSPFKKEVFQYDTDGKFIAQYPSLNEAARQLGIRSDGISACLRGKQNTAYGFQWFYIFKDNTSPTKINQKPKNWKGNRNIELDKKIDKIIEMYLGGENVTSISKKLGVHRDSIKQRIKEYKESLGI
jgi:hypothetical protein